MGEPLYEGPWRSDVGEWADIDGGTEVVVFRADSQPCPWVETGDEGTSFCRLAARATPGREQIRAQVERMAPPSLPGDPTVKAWVDIWTDDWAALLSGDPTESADR